MARNKSGSPRIKLEITEKDRATAVESNSGGCLIADALKRKGYASPSVDMATIRVTDKETGLRYTYLTPPGAQHLLLSFDQGWPVNGVAEVELKRAVQVVPVMNGKQRKKGRAERFAELEGLEETGEITPQEKSALVRMRKANERGVASRPSSPGPVVVVGRTVIGGRPRMQGPAHPNLLRGRNRIYGAKLANPGQAFEEAVSAAVEAQQTQEAK